MQLERQNLKIVKWLKEELKDCKSVLDLGCGQSSMLQYCDVPYSVGVEYWKPYIEESQKKGIHNEYVNADITELEMDRGQFDAVMLIDVLEHIEKLKAKVLMWEMERWAAKKVIISVPNGFLPQGDSYGDGNIKQHHVSGWDTREFEAMGYRVRGFDGWRPLRGDGADIVPTKTRLGHYLLSAMSMLSEPIVESMPEYAFHLFAVRDKNELD